MNITQPITVAAQSLPPVQKPSLTCEALAIYEAVMRGSHSALKAAKVPS